jgi:putative transposase
LPMLEGVADLDLRQLNEATLVFVEVEYNRKLHSELKCSPLEKFLHVKDVGRPCPSSQQLQWAFMAEVGRTQRRSDGTLSLEGRRYEVPSRYGHLDSLRVRYAAWDLSQVYLCDPTTGAVLCRIFPLDKHKNAEGRRALREGLQASNAPAAAPAPVPGMAPLMQKILHQYATTGLPPAYLPKDEVSPQKPHEQETPSSV